MGLQPKVGRTAGAHAGAYGALLPAHLPRRSPPGPTRDSPHPRPPAPSEPPTRSRHTLLTSRGPGKGCVGPAPRERPCCPVCLACEWGTWQLQLPTSVPLTTLTPLLPQGLRGSPAALHLTLPAPRREHPLPGLAPLAPAPCPGSRGSPTLHAAPNQGPGRKKEEGAAPRTVNTPRPSPATFCHQVLISAQLSGPGRALGGTREGPGAGNFSFSLNLCMAVLGR